MGWRSEPASDRQVAFLLLKGFGGVRSWTKGEASDRIQKILSEKKTPGRRAPARARYRKPTVEQEFIPPHCSGNFTEDSPFGPCGRCPNCTNNHEQMRLYELRLGSPLDLEMDRAIRLDL